LEEEEETRGWARVGEVARIVSGEEGRLLKELVLAAGDAVGLLVGNGLASDGAALAAEDLGGELAGAPGGSPLRVGLAGVAAWMGGADGPVDAGSSAFL